MLLCTCWKTSIANKIEIWSMSYVHFVRSQNLKLKTRLEKIGFVWNLTNSVYVYSYQFQFLNSLSAPDSITNCYFHKHVTTQVWLWALSREFHWKLNFSEIFCGPMFWRSYYLLEIFPKFWQLVVWVSLWFSITVCTAFLGSSKWWSS